jgi:hypothetical protein
MPKRNKQKRPIDVNQLAHHLVSLSTEDGADIAPATPAQISLVMAELGRRGGRIGGKRRLETMTVKERKSVAKKAARARWEKAKKLKDTTR